ncbi:MAG: RluA family pseudouridine synthase [Peptostreptococcaceae bacterium]|nr:RluA family pseudouridine synthase [Peptostreptococcaceae bacterium]
MNPLVIYEDNHILVALKPFGMPSQEDDSKDPDMLSWVKNYVKEKYQKPGEVYIGLLHRLDRVAGGLMVFARTSKAASRLSEQIRSRSLEKTYQVVIEGIPRNKEGVLEDYLRKDTLKNKVSPVSKNQKDAKFARLSYRTLLTKQKLSLLEIDLETGRAHQIRVQFSSRGNPIFGDAKYGSQNPRPVIALWSYRLRFIHPTKKEPMEFSASPSVYLRRIYPWDEFQ